MLMEYVPYQVIQDFLNFFHQQFRPIGPPINHEPFDKATLEVMMVMQQRVTTEGRQPVIESWKKSNRFID